MKAIPWLILLLIVGLAPQSLAQSPLPGGRQAPPPQGMGGQLPPPAPAVPDTVQIRVSVPDSLPQPTSVLVVQDTLTFGGYLHLILDYDSDQNAAPEPNLDADPQWLAPVIKAPQVLWGDRWLQDATAWALDVSALPAATGSRVIKSFRVYRRDPLQIAYQNDLSPVLFVRGQTEGTEQTATIRSPRSITWTPWRLIGAAAILLILAALIYRWWHRRQRAKPLEHWTPADPAWLALAIGLKSLISDNVLARGESRVFLDRLASLTREYVAVRYCIAAREMTGDEIIRACQNLGHDLNHPRGFAHLIKLADRERYNPVAPAIPFCREQAVQVFGRVQAVRLLSRGASVGAERQLAADQAWSYLVRELGNPAQNARPSTSSLEVG